MKVSVIIPLYNKARHIERALRSVLAQTSGDYEIVVVDDGSTDGGDAVVASIADVRIRYIRQANAGVSAARNRGIHDSKGELVAFLDADDAWKPHFLATILGLYSRYPEAGLYSTAYEIKSPGEAACCPSFRTPSPAPWEGVLPSYFTASLGNPVVWTSATAVRRVVLDDVGGFPVGERRAEDLDLWARIALKYPVVFSHAVGAVYYQDADNRACVRGNDNPERIVVRTLKAALDRGIAEPERSAVREYIFLKVLDSVEELVFSGRAPDARKFMTKYGTRLFMKKKIYWYLLSFLPVSLLRTYFTFKDNAWDKAQRGSVPDQGSVA